MNYESVWKSGDGFSLILPSKHCSSLHHSMQYMCWLTAGWVTKSFCNNLRVEFYVILLYDPKTESRSSEVKKYSPKYSFIPADIKSCLYKSGLTRQTLWHTILRKNVDLLCFKTYKLTVNRVLLEVPSERSLKSTIFLTSHHMRLNELLTCVWGNITVFVLVSVNYIITMFYVSIITRYSLIPKKAVEQLALIYWWFESYK